MDGRRPALTAGSRATRAGVAAVPAVFLAVFFVWPVAAIIARGLSVRGVRDVLTDPGLRSVAWFTLWQATVLDGELNVSNEPAHERILTL